MSDFSSDPFQPAAAAADAPRWDAYGGHDASVGDACRMARLIDRVQHAFADDVDAMLLTADDIEAVVDIWHTTQTLSDKLQLALGVASAHADARGRLTQQVADAEAMASRYAGAVSVLVGVVIFLGLMLLGVMW